MEKGSSDLVKQSDASSRSKSRSRTRDKRSKKKRKNQSSERESTSEHGTPSAPVAKKQKQGQPLRGIILSVSTLKEGQPVGKTSDNDDDGAAGYNDVCNMSKEMGAQVTSQVSKRVQLLICTRSAVDKTTQRVRKAFKKKIPIVDVAWLEACREAGVLVDKDLFRLDEHAKDAIDKRERNIGDETDPAVDIPTDAGWTESISYGCSCVCHENGAEKDCQWCSTGCAAC